MRIFPSCTILDKKQGSDAPFYDFRHPLKVFVQVSFPLRDLLCEAEAKDAVYLRPVIAWIPVVYSRPARTAS